MEQYQAGPYLADPFCLACAKLNTTGLFRIKDHAPDRFYQGECLRNHYIQTGFTEEIGYFVPLPSGGMIVLSRMRSDRRLTEWLVCPLCCRIYAAGEIFYECTRLLGLQIDTAIHDARIAAEGKRGPLRIAYMSFATIECRPRRVREFSKRDPEIDLDLK